MNLHKDLNQTKEFSTSELSHNKYYDFLSRYSWVFFGLICLIISYLVVWERGLYLDDYSFKVNAVDPFSGAITPLLNLPNDHFPMRILASLVAAKSALWISDYEFWIRLFTAVLSGINSLLLGVLVCRILRSKFAGVISGWLFLAPIFSGEAVLWISTIAYVISSGFALTSINLAQLASTKEQDKWKYIILAALFLTMMMFSFEGCMSAIGIIILISFITAYQSNKTIFDSLRLTFLNSILLVIIFGLLIIILRQSPLLSNRGGIETSFPFLIDKIASFYNRIVWMTVSEDWGLNLLMESFINGYATLTSSFWGLSLFSGAVIMLITTILTWDDKALKASPQYRIGVLVLFTGILWIIFSILIPGVFSKGQIVEYRMLYFPTAGFSVTVSAVFWLISRSLGFNKIFDKVVIGVIGLTVLLNSITMLGYCQLFAERNKLDQNQISAVKELLPSGYDLPSNVTIVLYKFDENINFKYDSHISSNKLLFGVFETDWTAAEVLKAVYKSRDLSVITQNRWSSWKFDYDLRSHADKPLEINGKFLPPETVLFITYYGGKAYLVNQLIFNSQEKEPKAVSFPLAEKFHLLGAPIISIKEKLPANS